MSGTTVATSGDESEKVADEVLEDPTVVANAVPEDPTVAAEAAAAEEEEKKRQEEQKRLAAEAAAKTQKEDSDGGKGGTFPKAPDEGEKEEALADRQAIWLIKHLTKVLEIIDLAQMNKIIESKELKIGGGD